MRSNPQVPCPIPILLAAHSEDTVRDGKVSALSLGDTTTDGTCPVDSFHKYGGIFAGASNVVIVDHRTVSHRASWINVRWLNIDPGGSYDVGMGERLFHAWQAALPL